MSDDSPAGAAVSQDPPTPGHAGATAGMLLRQAREAAGLHIGALSVALKVPVRKLEALEADQLDQLPDAVFARALASSVCRNLKIDPAPVLARLPVQVMPDLQLDSSTTDRTNLHPPRALWHAPLLSRLPRPVLGAALALVVGALVLALLPDIGLRDTEAVIADALPAATLPPTVPEAAASEPVAAAAPAPSAVAAAPAAAAPASAAVPAVPAAAAPVSEQPVLGLRARGPAWVEVTDSAGAVQLRKTLAAGDAVAVSGSLPLSVVVGRADVIEVQVRGQALDLLPLARDNVARFQVK